ncbi:MAG: hypothetical protein AAGF83_04585 [Cyanobacteria bacterium P01_G01_bin.67]
MKLKLSFPKINQLLFLLLLFIYIYAPPFNFIPLGINKLIAPFTVVGLLFFYKSAIWKILQQKHLFIALFLIAISIIYAFIIDTSTIYASDLAFTRKHTFSQTMILLEVLPITLFLCVFAIRKLRFTFADFLSSLVTVAAVQSLMAIIMLLLPNFRTIILTTVLNYNPSKDKLFRPDLYAFRSFGLSQDLLFSLSIVQGIAIGCALSLCLYNFSKYKYSLLLIPPLLLSIALNARIGLLGIIIFVAVTLIFSILKFKFYLLSKFILFTLVSSLIIYFSVSNLDLIFDTGLEKNIEWASNVFLEGKNFVEGDDTNTGNFGTITRRYWHLPDNTSARVFGEGRYLFDSIKSSILSDVGYVRKIYFGGYIYSLLTYSALIYLFIGSQHKQKQDTFKPLLYSLLLTVLLSHLKGDLFLPIPGYRISFLIFLFAISERRLAKPTTPQLNSRFIPWYTQTSRNLKS